MDKHIMLVNRLSRLHIGLFIFIYSLVLEVFRVCNLLTERDVHCPQAGVSAGSCCLFTVTVHLIYKPGKKKQKKLNTKTAKLFL